jgi:hypothetical protein
MTLESSDAPKRRDRPQRHLECHRCDPGVDQVEDRPWVQGLNDHGGNRRSVKRLGNADRADQDRGDQDLGDRGRGDQSRGDQDLGDQSRGDQSRGDRGRGDRGRADQSRGDQSRADQSRADQSRADQDLGDEGRGNPELRRLRWRRPTRRSFSSSEHDEAPRVRMTTAKSLAVCTPTPDQIAARGRGGRDRRDPRRRARVVSGDFERGRVPPSRGHRGPKQEGSGHGNLGRQRFLDDVAAAPAAAETQANRRRKQTEDANKPNTQSNTQASGIARSSARKWSHGRKIDCAEAARPG